MCCENKTFLITPIFVMAIGTSVLEDINLHKEPDTQSPHICKHYSSKQGKYKLAIISTVVVMLVIIIGFLILNRSTECQKSSSVSSEPEKIDDLHIISRDEWLARPPVEQQELVELVLPIHRVIIADTATYNCSTQAACSYRIQTIQNYQMDSILFNDIAYNFLIGGDGNIYVGRGWDAQGAHTKGFNVDSICIAFIGTFSTTSPPEKQLNAAKRMLNEGVRLNKLVENYKLYGARQLSATSSPGNALYEIIKTWPNWSNQI
ncbi:peptidoglycan-recognition protein SD-like isoform X2 [Episyrphus balteatus]|uniref:peptidoglycan-recognition protein SD-like isoform X2 n=1 Tax=Episyrphus balteatus TaxID=286459 RepID=UPI002484E257|nr:peptidoglycan-recognition protein SD-like isoform X2 [Episyrphus balteatus]